MDLGRPVFHLNLGAVLTRIRRLVPQQLHQPIKPRGDDRPQARPDPVDPVIAVEAGQHDARPKTPRRVQAGAREVRARQHGDEQRQAEPDGRDEGGPLLLDGQEKHGEDEEDGQEHLDEDALRDRGAAAEGGAHRQGRRRKVHRGRVGSSG